MKLVRPHFLNLVALAAGLFLSLSSSAAVLSVSNTSDSGVGSLRNAMLDANLLPGGDTIIFNIPGPGPHTIRPLTGLPLITDPVMIDATTQPGYAGQPIIELDGSQAGVGADGFIMISGLSTIRGFAINRFDNFGVTMENFGSNIIDQNYLGTDITGTISLPNGQAGVGVFDSEDNLIGGTTQGKGNLISGQQLAGIFIIGPTSARTRIKGNLIGTDVTGTLPLGSVSNGVLIVDAPSTVIGGRSPAERNVISGNAQSGIYLLGAVATQSRIAGNYIGTDITGFNAIPNGADGITIQNGKVNTIGGELDGDSNLISGNGEFGIFIFGPTNQNNIIRGNIVGTNLDGDSGMSNAFSGIGISSGSGNIVGGVAPLSGNLISGNGQVGIYLFDATSNNVVQGNFIGTDTTGTLGLPNGFDGITIELCQGNLVGGQTPEAANLISGNQQSGIYLLNATNNYIHGNLVGTDLNGASRVPNGGDGITLQNASGNFIGSATNATPNILSGNHLSGIYVTLGSNNVIQGNYIGTDIDGSIQLSNRLDGITIDFSAGNLIGGSQPNSGNLISGNFLTGISITNSPLIGNTIAGNLIGTTLSGTSPLPNGVAGIELLEAPGNLIGGTNPGSRNVIASNPELGIFVDGSNSVANLIQGNYIGTGINGTEDLGNGADGIFLQNAPFNQIGGPEPGAGNVISHNGESGIYLFDENTVSNIVQGNFIGTDPTGTLPIGNSLDGITISYSSHNQIGGPEPGAGNVISGNTDNGVYITHLEATFNIVQGNLIGTASDGIANLGNLRHQLHIENDSSDNTIGGYGPGEQNVLAHTVLPDFDGIRIRSGVRNRIEGNSIFNNSGLGIDLGLNLVEPNDDKDSDSGANELQNYPLLISAHNGTGDTVITGSLNSRPNRTFRIDFFTSPTCNPAGYGEGTHWIGTTTVDTAGSGNANFITTIPHAVSAGHVITATATDADGNTSEFSTCETVTGDSLSADVRISKTATPDPAVAGQPLTYEITIENLGPDDAFGVRVTETLPPSVTFVSSSPSPSARYGQVYFFDIDSLADGTSTTITINVIPRESGSIANRATIASQVPDPSLSNNSTEIQTEVLPSNANCDPTSVAIVQSGNEIVLTWESIPGCFQLQETSSLLPPITWTDVPDAPTVTSLTHEVRLPIAPTSRFFRLLQQ